MAPAPEARTVTDVVVSAEVAPTTNVNVPVVMFALRVAGEKFALTPDGNPSATKLTSPVNPLLRATVN
jgi:hypothetical protein